MADASMTGCFVCDPSPPRAPEEPWDWSDPRRLCHAHFASLGLEGCDESFEAVLQAVAPAEGSGLGALFNPVTVETGKGRRIRGWADWAGGGLAVLEDRFQARSVFEFRAFERHASVDVLYALRFAHRSGAPLASKSELLGLLFPVDLELPRDFRRRRGPVNGLQGLVYDWNFEMRLTRLRAAQGRRFPESESAAQDWFGACADGGDVVEKAEEPAFLAALVDLARRRFGAGV